MTQESTSPLGPPPRRVHVRRGVRNVRRAYLTLFTLVIVLFGGWALLDLWNWSVLDANERMLAIGFALLAALAVGVMQIVHYPLRRELRLARRGEVALGQIVSVGTMPRRRPVPLIVYTFRTNVGVTVEGRWIVPRRFPVQTLAEGMSIEVLYDLKKPRVNTPRLALELVEFIAVEKRKE